MKERTILINKETVINLITIFSLPVIIILSPTGPQNELIKLLSRYRRDDGGYDCLVPGSGGKDSVFAAHILKYKYNMNPLTITWAPHLFTDIGFKNFQNY